MFSSMELSTLARNLQTVRQSGPREVDITGLYYDSRQVKEGGLFFAWQGLQEDGHRFIPEAIDRGARGVVMEKAFELPPGVAGMVVPNAREAMASAAMAFFGRPTANIPVVGVTGTNGKTTVTYLIESVLRAAGKHPAVLGTVNCRFESIVRPALHTTPEATDLLATAAEFRQAGSDALVLEVSSHALAQGRTAEIDFAVGVFTNLTPEHLDFHDGMEDYFASKRRLFGTPGTGGTVRPVLNVDDPYGARLAAELPGAMTCGLGSAAIRPRAFRCSLEGVQAVLETPSGVLEINSPLLGRFNLYNLLCAAGAGLALGLPPAAVADGLNRAPSVPGRLERIENDLGALVLVDYAHTGDALENVLTTLRDLSPRRLLVVFGCGGDRDRSKRPIMGECAARHADLVILTSDNPRSEDPLAILDEIRGGVVKVIPEEWTLDQATRGLGRGFTTLPDRRSAIEFAVSMLAQGDLLLVAGKGHEDYQIIGNQRLHFDDREELRQAVNRRRAAS